MLDDTNDNLPQVDGNEMQNESVANASSADAQEQLTVEVPVIAEVLEVKIEGSHAKVIENEVVENVISDNNSSAIEDVASKDDLADLPLLDYDNLTMDELVSALESMVGVENVISVKDQIEHIKTSFLSKYNHFIEEKKDEFAAENTDTTADFEYHLPAKHHFDKLYSQFRDKRSKHFKSLETNMKSNLENRLAIVEDLKHLVDSQGTMKDALKQFNDLRDRWKNAGSIPKDKYNHVWNNYHFHVDNFYDYLHLDREARDMDFKHNLEQKQKIVARCEELVAMTDVNKAFRELQDLHKIWKEDIGPVAKEHRDEVWNQFSALTKIMHDKRDVLFEGLRASEGENLVKKHEIVAQIEAITAQKMEAQANWNAQVQKIEILRTEFFAVGKVPQEVNEKTWSAFKNAVRQFNITKNSFYKDVKKEQNDNLRLKEALVAKAQSLQESEDFASTTPILKQLQEDWKKIGHVPRKNSDAIWTTFRAACNHYFDRLKASKSAEDETEVANFDLKKGYLDTVMKDFAMSGDHKTDLDAIKIHIEAWKGFGRVPQNRRHIDGKFNKQLDGLFEKLSLSKKDSDMMRFSNRIENLSDSNDTRKLDGEKIFLTRKIEEIQSEMFQLENNIQFFTNTKNAKKENSIVTEVRKNIALKKEEIDELKAKLKQLKKIIETPIEAVVPVVEG